MPRRRRSSVPAEPNRPTPSASAVATVGVRRRRRTRLRRRPRLPVGPADPESPGASVVPDNVRLALDWTPNTNHTGFYVSSAKGWYAESGIHLQILPYNQTAPETLVAAGQAECGISFQDSLTFAVAAGAHAQVGDGDPPAQRERDRGARPTARSSGRATSTARPTAGFGYPADHPTIQVVIKHDGGKGVFKEVTLNACAYEALYARQVDLTIVFTAWEGIEAKERGIDLRYFKPTDYGFPDSYQVVLACNTDWLARHARRRTPVRRRDRPRLPVRGVRPGRAAGILIASNPGVFDANPHAAARECGVPGASQELYVNDAGLVGPQTLEQWTATRASSTGEGLLTDAQRQAADGAARLRVAVHERLPARRAVGRDAAPSGPTAPISARRSSSCALLLSPGRRTCDLSGISPLVLPAPSRILSALVDFRDLAWSCTRSRRSSRRWSGSRCRSSAAIAAAIAMDQVGAGCGGRSIRCWSGSQTIPIVAIAPLLVVWFGFGLLPKVLVIVLVTFFPITVALLDGFASVPGEAMDLMRDDRGDREARCSGSCAGPRRCRRSSPACGSPRPTRSWRRSSASTSAPSRASGIWMQMSRNAFRADLVFVAILIASVLSVAAVRRGVMRWSAGRSPGTGRRAGRV